MLPEVVEEILRNSFCLSHKKTRFINVLVKRLRQKNKKVATVTRVMNVTDNLISETSTHACVRNLCLQALLFLFYVYSPFCSRPFCGSEEMSSFGLFYLSVVLFTLKWGIPISFCRTLPVLRHSNISSVLPRKSDSSMLHSDVFLKQKLFILIGWKYSMSQSCS